MDRDEMHVRVFAVLLQSHRAATGGYPMMMPKVEAIADEAMRVVDEMRPRRPRDGQGRFRRVCSDMAAIEKSPTVAGDAQSKAGVEEAIRRGLSRSAPRFVEPFGIEHQVAAGFRPPCDLDLPGDEIGPHGIDHRQEPLRVPAEDDIPHPQTGLTPAHVKQMQVDAQRLNSFFFPEGRS